MKRIVSVVLIASCLFALSCPALAVEKSTETETAAAYLRAQGIMVGDETGNMNLDQGLTRAELAVILAHIVGNPEHIAAEQDYYSKQCAFTDVPAWAKVYVGYCAANGLVSGYGDGRYGSNDPVTPAAACTVMLRCVMESAMDWTYDTACQKAVELGLAPAETLAGPTMTRGGMAVLIYRTMAEMGYDMGVSDNTTAALASDGSRYVPKAGDVISCSDGTNYTIMDVSRWNNSMFSVEETEALPTATCDWSLLPQPELPEVEARHFTSDGKEYLYLRNHYETRRMLYTLYNAIGSNPQTWQNGKPVTRADGSPLVRINLSIPNEVNASSFWPWRSEQITELFNSCPPGEYSLEAWDVYCDGVFRYTQYYVYVK